MPTFRLIRGEAVELVPETKSKVKIQKSKKGKVRVSLKNLTARAEGREGIVLLPIASLRPGG
jgi:hypothetical protein